MQWKHISHYLCVLDTMWHIIYLCIIYVIQTKCKIYTCSVVGGWAHSVWLNSGQLKKFQFMCCIRKSEPIPYVIWIISIDPNNEKFNKCVNSTLKISQNNNNGRPLCHVQWLFHFVGFGWINQMCLCECVSWLLNQTNALYSLNC